MFILTVIWDTDLQHQRPSFHQKQKQSYMQIKSNNPNFDSGPNIGGWSHSVTLLRQSYTMNNKMKLNKTQIVTNRMNEYLFLNIILNTD